MNLEKQLALINGNFIASNKWLQIYNPTTDEIIGTVPALTATEINASYESAHKVQPSWEKTPLLTRIKLLDAWKEQIIVHQTTLATLMVKEIAKGYKAALNEITRSVAYIDYTLQEALRMHPISYSGNSWGNEQKIGIFEYVAKGVVLAISPFNYPVNLALSKIFPALVMGNTVVFKPATQGSLVGLYLAKLAHHANIPAGVFNAVTGKGSEISDVLVQNEYINVISFTGSAAVGKHIAANAKKVDLILELGGKDPAIVLADADIELAASKIISGAFSYSGQRCTAIKRVLVDNKIKPALVAKLTKKVAQLTVGNPEDDCDITPVVEKKTVEYITNLITAAQKAGAKIVTPQQPLKKNLMVPTIVDDVTTKMAIAWEEPFGPVLPIIGFENIDEAITIANASNYGLQAAVFTENINQALLIAKQLTTGTVNINDLTQRGPDHFPFIGIKDSGLGTQGIRDSLIAFSRLKGIVINWKNK